MPLVEATAGSIPAHLLHFERLKECGHDIHGDAPERVFGAMRAFIASEAAAS
jgi:proline iminopeptidase